MDGLFAWLLERKALTLVGIAVVLLGAFVPWPNIAIAGVVVGIGGVLMLVQIPFAMRAAQQPPAPKLVTTPRKETQPGD